MKLQPLFYVLLVFILQTAHLTAQENSNQRQASMLWPIAPNFTVTDTEGNSHTLYTALNAGKTIVLDFFQTSSPTCAQYAYIIQNIYATTGYGANDIDFWGIDYNHNNAEVIQYKLINSITYPCASGSEGGGNPVTTNYQIHYSYTGFPTYAVICPDKTVYWDINFPPTDTGFNSFFNKCIQAGINDPEEPVKAIISSPFPNPFTQNILISFQPTLSPQAGIRIYDLLGNTVFQMLTMPTSQLSGKTLPIDLGHLPNGMYYLNAYDDKQSMTCKIVKNTP